MSDSLTIYRLLKKDPRYPIEAYQFVREGLAYATEVLQLGQTASNVTPSGKAAGGPLHLTAPNVVDLELSSSQFQKEIDKLADLAGMAEDDEKKAATAGNQSPDAVDSGNEELDLFDDLETTGETFDDELGGEVPEEQYEGRHLTGQELCEALRLYALQQFGFMAISVLAQWGITKTNDFGSIVYNLIDIGLMRKSAEDRQDHFNDVYDFQIAFVDNFKIESPGL